MFKYLKIALVSLFAVAVASCEKDEIGQTSTEAVAGEWVVLVDYIAPDGEVEADIAGGEILTYNTNADNGREMYIDDFGYYGTLIGIKGKIACDPASQTFGSPVMVENLYNPDMSFMVRDGKIVNGGAVSSLGHVSDAISFYVELEGDAEGECYFFHGYRRTGFDGDDQY